MSSILTRPKWALCSLLIMVVFNIWLFLYQQSKGEIFEPALDRFVTATPGKFPTNRKVGSSNSSKKSVYRIYWDDREHGLLVVSRSEGTAWDKNDAETQRILKLVAQSEKEGYIVHEIDPFVPEETNQITKAGGFSAGSHTNKDGVNHTSGVIDEYSEYQKTFVKFLSDIIKTVNDHKPKIGALDQNEHYSKAREENKYSHREGRMPVYGGHWREAYTKEPVRTYDYLRYFYRLSTEEVATLKKSQDDYVSSMKTAIPEDLMRLGKAFDFMTGNGIVYLGGGNYNQLVITSLSVLRSLGSVMPVEVIIPRRKDFDIDFCNNLLPKLNGRCKMLEDFLPESTVKELRGFQLKSVSLLVSSFQNILYLDADNIPVKNPDYIFVNEPFKSSGMIIWPDLWRRSTSPHFYEIAGIPIDSSSRARNSYFKGDPRGTNPEQVSFHDLNGTIPEASSETGQMIIDKKKHFTTLILAMYYNFWGPGYYYALLTQGAAGEGDKETFIAAAHKLGIPYYQVMEFNREFGPFNRHKKHLVFGMGQFDPIIDFAQANSPDSVNVPRGEYAAHDQDSTSYNYDFHYYRSHSLMFLHANWPKFHLKDIFGDTNSGRGPKQDGKRRRMYNEEIMQETGGVDVELLIMRQVESWACNTEVQITDVPAPGSDGRKKICREVALHIELLLTGKEN